MSRVHAARDHAVDLLLGFAAEVGSECRRPCCFRIGAVKAGQGDGVPGARRRLAATNPLNDCDRGAGSGSVARASISTCSDSAPAVYPAWLPVSQPTAKATATAKIIAVMEIAFMGTGHTCGRGKCFLRRIYRI